MECRGSLGVIASLLGSITQGDSELQFTGISTDTRSIEKGMLFVALNGENFRGADFVPAAMERGAVAAVAESLPPGVTGIEVPDGLEAYQLLARWYRRQLRAALVAVTGSCGKTSVKEIVATIFAGRGLSFKNRANFNNQVGVAKTLLDAPLASEWGVVEAGTNHPGEIEPLAHIIEPQLSIITNVGVSHVENFADIDALIDEKMSLCVAMGEEGISLLPGDIEHAEKFKEYPRNKIVTYGLDASCDYHPEGLQFDELGRGSFSLRSVPVSTDLCGEHAVRNTVAALAATAELGIPLAEGAAALRGYAGFDKRFLLSEVAGRRLIDDTYNANLISTLAALETVASMRVAGKKVAVLGSMLELGDDAPAAHKTVLERAATLVDMVYTVGAEYGAVADVAQRHFKTRDELLAALLAETGAGDTLLFKGSRGMRMELILTAYREAIETDR